MLLECIETKMWLTKTLFVCGWLLIVASATNYEYVPTGYKKCPPRKKFDLCPPACPIHCNNKDNPPKICPAVCRPGVNCFCQKGFIERSESDFSCIRPSKCPDACQWIKCGNSNEICKNGKCVCREGYVKQDSVCVDACILRLCLKGRRCKEGKCLCSDGKPEVNGKCPTLCLWPKIYVPCSTSCPVHCGNVHDPPTKCTKDCRQDVTCVCSRGFIERSEKDFRCVRPSQCPTDECAHGCGKYEECKHRRCVCREGYDRVNTECVDSCKRVRCPRYSTCKAGKCNCDEGYFKQGSLCVDECVLIDCKDGMICKKGQCRCPVGFDEVDRKCLDKCRRMRCSQDCKAGTCICKEGFIMKNGLCVGLCDGRKCPPGSTCVRNKCRCRPGNGYFNSWCIRY